MSRSRAAAVLLLALAATAAGAWSVWRFGLARRPAEDRSALLVEADRLAAAGDCARAVPLYQQALAADPTDLPTFAGWMRCLAATAPLHEEAAALVRQTAAGASSPAVVRMATDRLRELDKGGEPGDALKPIAAALCRSPDVDRAALARTLARLFADWLPRGQLAWAADVLRNPGICGAAGKDNPLAVDVLVRLLEGAGAAPNAEAALAVFPPDLLAAAANQLLQRGQCAAARPAFGALARLAPVDEAAQAAWRECEARAAAPAPGRAKPSPRPRRGPHPEAPPFLDIETLRTELAGVPAQEAALDWFAAADQAALARQRDAARQIYEEIADDMRVGRACRELAVDRTRLLAADGEGAWFDFAGSPVRADWATKLLARWTIWRRAPAGPGDPRLHAWLADNAPFAPRACRCADELTFARARLLIAAKSYAEARVLLQTIDADPELQSIARDLLAALKDRSAGR